MAKEVKDEKALDPMEELVEYTAPYLGVDGRDITAGVNGEIIRIKRGETVKIKRKYLEVLQHAAEQEMEAYKARQVAQNSNGPIANL